MAPPCHDQPCAGPHPPGRAAGRHLAAGRQALSNLAISRLLTFLAENPGASKAYVKLTADCSTITWLPVRFLFWHEGSLELPAQVEYKHVALVFVAL